MGRACDLRDNDLDAETETRARELIQLLLSVFRIVSIHFPFEESALKIILLGNVDTGFVKQGAGCVPGIFLTAKGGYVDDQVFQGFLILLLSLEFAVRFERNAFEKEHGLIECPDDCHTAAMDVVQNCLTAHNDQILMVIHLELANNNRRRF